METLEELSNGFTIGYLDGEWYLFDDEGVFVDKCDSRELAETVAFSMKPPRSTKSLQPSHPTNASSGSPSWR